MTSGIARPELELSNAARRRQAGAGVSTEPRWHCLPTGVCREHTGGAQRGSAASEQGRAESNRSERVTGAMIDTENRSSVVGGRRRRGLALTVVVAGLLIWGGWDWWARRNYGDAIAKIDQEGGRQVWDGGPRPGKASGLNANSDEALICWGFANKRAGEKLWRRPLDEGHAGFRDRAQRDPGTHAATLRQWAVPRAEEAVNDAAEIRATTEPICACCSCRSIACSAGSTKPSDC